MPIDLSTERGITAASAAKYLPSPKTDGPSHVSRVIRLMTRGTYDAEGVLRFLEGAKIGGGWVTTVEAIQRYCEVMAPRDPGVASCSPDPAQIPSQRTPSAIRKSDAAAERKLDQLGIRSRVNDKPPLGRDCGEVTPRPRRAVTRGQGLTPGHHGRGLGSSGSK